MSNDGRERLVAEIPEEAKAILEEEEGFIWELVTESIFNTYGGERLTSLPAIDREIELTERKKRNSFERMQDAREDYERHGQRVEALKERREEMEEQAESKTDALDRILQSMAKHGSNAYVGHGTVERLATKWFGGNEKAALGALKERSNEADYNLAENRFEEPGVHSAGSPVSLKSIGGDADD